MGILFMVPEGAGAVLADAGFWREILYAVVGGLVLGFGQMIAHKMRKRPASLTGVREYLCLYFDDYRLLHYEAVPAESVEEAKKMIKILYGKDTSCEVCRGSRPIPVDGDGWKEKMSSFFGMTEWYLARRRRDRLVFKWNRFLMLGRPFFLVGALVSLSMGEIGFSIFFLLLLALNLSLEWRMVVWPDCVVYVKQFFRTTRRRVETARAERLLTAGREFVSETGKTFRWYFLYAQRGDERILLSSDMNRGSIRRTAARIGAFWNVPVEAVEEQKTMTAHN